MATQEIPRKEWTTFFDGFSKQHEGWRVTLEVFAPEIGAQQEASVLPFAGITVASQDKKPETIAINLGNAPEDHVTHTIAGPEHVWLQQTSEGQTQLWKSSRRTEPKHCCVFVQPCFRRWWMELFRVRRLVDRLRKTPPGVIA